MACTHSAASPEAGAPHVPTVLFTPFSWHRRAKREVPVSVDSGRVAEFAGSVRDVSAGVRHVMQIIEHDDLAADSQGSALLGVQQKADLLRLCTFALGKLEDDSNLMVEYLDEAQPTARGTHCRS